MSVRTVVLLSDFRMGKATEGDSRVLFLSPHGACGLLGRDPGVCYFGGSFYSTFPSPSAFIPQTCTIHSTDVYRAVVCEDPGRGCYLTFSVSCTCLFM